MATTPSVSAGAGVRRYTVGAAADARSCLYVLGITPAEPGYRRYEWRLGPDGCARRAGAVPTPHGLVEVRITGSEAEIDSPVPALVVMRTAPRLGCRRVKTGSPSPNETLRLDEKWVERGITRALAFPT